MRNQVQATAQATEITPGMPVVSNTSWAGTVVIYIAATSGQPAAIRVRWQDGEETTVPLNACEVRDGEVIVQFAASTPTTADRGTMTVEDGETLTVPIITEVMHTETVWREAGVVTVRVQTEETPQTLTAQAVHEEAFVEQVEIGRVLADGEVVEPRQEGDVSIIPMVREEAVLVIRRVLVHELRVSKRPVATTETVQTTLRQTRVSVDAGTLASRTHIDAAVTKGEREPGE